MMQVVQKPNMAMQVLLHCRDCRKGKGERLITRSCSFMVA